MKNTPKRIHIIGPSGIGKTTLAKHLSKIAGLPLIELDPIIWTNHGRRTNQEIKTDLGKILNQNTNWVSEGIFINGIDKVFELSEQIIWMDLPLRINLTRVTKRFIKNKLTGKDHWGFISFLILARDIVGYYTRRATESSGRDGDITPAILEKYLSPYKDKLIRIKSSKDHENFLNSFTEQI